MYAMEWNSVGATSNTSLMTALGAVGIPAVSIPHPYSARYGIMWNYRSGMTYNGNTAYGLMQYWLSGTNQNCGLGDVVVQGGSGTDPWITSTTGYTGNVNGNQTACFVALY